MKLSIISGGSKGLGAALVEYYRDNEYEVIEFSRSGNTKYNVRLTGDAIEIEL